MQRRVAFTEYFACHEGCEQAPFEVAAYSARMREEHDSLVFGGKSQCSRSRMMSSRTAKSGRRSGRTGATFRRARRALSFLEPLGVANVEEPVAGFGAMAELWRMSAIPFSAYTSDVELAAALGTPDALVLGLGFTG